MMHLHAAGPTGVPPLCYAAERTFGGPNDAKEAVPCILKDSASMAGFGQHSR